MQDYFGQMPAEQKSALGTALVQSPATPVSSVQPGDVIVTVGAGDVWKIGRELAGVPF